MLGLTSDIFTQNSFSFCNLRLWKINSRYMLFINMCHLHLIHFASMKKMRSSQGTIRIVMQLLWKFICVEFTCIHVYKSPFKKCAICFIFYKVCNNSHYLFDILLYKSSLFMFLCLLRYFCVEVIVFYILLGSLRGIVTMFSFEINIYMN